MKTIDIPSSLAADAAAIRDLLGKLPDNTLASKMIQTLDALESGNSLSVRPAPDQTVSPQEASRILGISRPFLCKLLDDGVIEEQPRVGSHRKIKMRDLEAFVENRERASRQLAIDISRAEKSEQQLVRDIAGVDAATAESLGY
ncbi:excisionase family DNA-binding protein [Arthrobacter sp. YAF34]|uniref:excisionase family DNA-binding protein n=1 Tax=Arthrobacter sp. YAF34 TaxID=3233083 RepID=UPI003F93391A